jgi:hypothetical protein
MCSISTGSEEPFLNYKELEQTRGFLCHLSMTFELINPFLVKGFQLTISGPLPRQDAEGWKIVECSWDAYVHQQVAEGLMTEDEALEAINPPDYDDIPTPKEVMPVTRLELVLKALQSILSAEHPPEVMIGTLIRGLAFTKSWRISSLKSQLFSLRTSGIKKS